MRPDDRQSLVLQRVQVLPEGMVELSAIAAAPVEVGGEPIAIFKKYAVMIDNSRYPELREALVMLSDVVNDLEPAGEAAHVFDFDEDPDDEDAGMGD